METFSTILGVLIAAWVTALSVGLLLRTEGAKNWFGDMLVQNHTLVTITGASMILISIVIVGHIFSPDALNGKPLGTGPSYLGFALFGLIVSLLSTLFLMFKNQSRMAARVGPMVLIILTFTYLYLSS